MPDPEIPKAGNPESRTRDGRELTIAERFAFADVRQMEAKWNGLVDRVKAIPEVDQRQVAIAVTEAEGAFMRLARAIARPERHVAEPHRAMADALIDALNAPAPETPA